MSCKLDVGMVGVGVGVWVGICGYNGMFVWGYYNDKSGRNIKGNSANKKNIEVPVLGSSFLRSPF